MEALIVIGIIVVIIWYQINKCPHGIYNGNNCKVCAEEKECRRLQKEEQQRRKEEMIRQAEEKKQEEAKKLKEEIEHQKMLWLEETRKLEFLLQLDPHRFQELMWLLFRKLGWEVKEKPFSQDGGSDGLLIRVQPL